MSVRDKLDEIIIGFKRRKESGFFIEPKVDYMYGTKIVTIGKYPKDEQKQAYKDAAFLRRSFKTLECLAPLFEAALSVAETSGNSETAIKNLVDLYIEMEDLDKLVTEKNQEKNQSRPILFSTGEIFPSHRSALRALELAFGQDFSKLLKVAIHFRTPLFGGAKARHLTPQETAAWKAMGSLETGHGIAFDIEQEQVVSN